MPISEWDLLLRMLAAVVLGGLIGYERELREQPAGLRTHILVALASATFMIVSSQFVFFQRYTHDGLVHVDSGRIASNVVVGIGFLGGGAIMHAGLQVKGLTTAASLWLVASLGLAAGSGMFAVAAMVTAITLFSLVALRYLVEAPRKRIVRLRVRLHLAGDAPAQESLAEFLRPVGAVVTELGCTRDVTGNRSKLVVHVRLPDEMHEDLLMRRLEAFPGVLRIKTTRTDA